MLLTPALGRTTGRRAQSRAYSRPAVRPPASVRVPGPAYPGPRPSRTGSGVHAPHRRRSRHAHRRDRSHHARGGYAEAVGFNVDNRRSTHLGAVMGTRERFAAPSLRRIFLARAHPPRGDFRQQAVRHRERPRPALHLLSTMPLPPIVGDVGIVHVGAGPAALPALLARRPAASILRAPSHPSGSHCATGSRVREFGSSGVQGGAPAASLYGIRADRPRRLAPRLRRLTVLTSPPSCRLRLRRGRVLSIFRLP